MNRNTIWFLAEASRNLKEAMYHTEKLPIDRQLLEMRIVLDCIMKELERTE